MRRCDLVLICLPISVLSSFLLFDAESTALSLLSDDAYYYVKIAQSIANGRGSSFDGISATNGYHPLWMLCIVALQHVVGDDRMAPLIASMLLSALVSGFTLALIHRAIHQIEAPTFGWFAVSLFCTPLLLGAMSNGLETGILLCALALFVWCSGRHALLAPSASPRARVCLGLLLGLMFLCRLDSVFIVLSAGVLLVASGLVARTPIALLLARLLATASGVLLLAIPYFLWNWVHFGHLSPISGHVKSTFPSVRTDLTLNGDLRIGLLIIFALVPTVLCVAYVDIRRGRHIVSVLASPLSILATGAVAHFAYVFTFMSWGVYWWHFAASAVALACALAQLLHRIGNNLCCRHAISFRVLTVVFALSGIGTHSWLLINKLARHREWHAGAQWARDMTSSDTVFAMKDAGLFGYFAERHVVNLDGKANGYDYLACLKRSDVTTYLAQANVMYIADINAIYVDDATAIAIPRAESRPVVLWMSRAREVYSSLSYTDRSLLSGHPNISHFAIWSIPSGR